MDTLQIYDHSKTHRYVWKACRCSGSTVSFLQSINILISDVTIYIIFISHLQMQKGSQERSPSGDENQHAGQ